MMEVGFLSFAYTLLKDAGAWLTKYFARMNALAIIEIRKKWKAEFESHLRRLDHAPTYGDAIIRDIRRMDSYPEIDEKVKGISPWFKVEIKGLYPRGIEVFLRIESVRYEKDIDGWRWADYDENGAVNAATVGRIPFEIIQAVDWEGDQYYNSPHIYCEFSKKDKQPYEEIVLYRIEERSTATATIFLPIGNRD